MPQGNFSPQGEFIFQRAIAAPLHIELESEEEEGDTLVTGALHLQSNNNSNSNNQSKSPLRQSKSPIGQARSPIRQSKSPLPPPAKRSSTLSPSSSSKVNGAFVEVLLCRFSSHSLRIFRNLKISIFLFYYKGWKTK